ncbi:hypothetical protein M885DRAFT_614720 [Pelagophyceae sp. CCMP2097]|nr:hypothetical protein M885DRAFT_614720 [Pelagophyceae sp. CCMP2097]|mmetsp:Transcript_31976/g.110538  ORF Transcript_31976/g.110538 Transcript_31976/m.110538 type:complete len:365 (+) Transcript_31976:101-1195(+)
MDVPAEVLEGMTLLRSLAITKEEFFARVKLEAQQRRVRQVLYEAPAPAAQRCASHDRGVDCDRRDSDRRASGAAEEGEAEERGGHGGGSPFDERFKEHGKLHARPFTADDDSSVSSSSAEPLSSPPRALRRRSLPDLRDGLDDSGLAGALSDSRRSLPDFPDGASDGGLAGAPGAYSGDAIADLRGYSDAASPRVARSSPPRRPAHAAFPRSSPASPRAKVAAAWEDAPPTFQPAVTARGNRAPKKSVDELSRLEALRQCYARDQAARRHSAAAAEQASPPKKGRDDYGHIPTKLHTAEARAALRIRALRREADRKAVVGCTHEPRLESACPDWIHAMAASSRYRKVHDPAPSTRDDALKAWRY